MLGHPVGCTRLTGTSYIFLTGTPEKEKEAGGDGEQKKYPYPKSVFFIISTEFCERFSFYGMKSKSKLETFEFYKCTE